MRVAFATCSWFPEGVEEEREVARELGAEHIRWDDPEADWDRYDRVVIRSTWDYTLRVEQFLAWCGAVGSGRLRNPPELVAFNADKRYLAELACATVPTTFVAAGEPLPELEGELVVKPNISGGARDTGRFTPATHDLARGLIERICGSGRVALVQPYLAAVDNAGETALVFLGGELSHTLRKRPVLAPDEIAPALPGGGPARAMLREDLVLAGSHTPAELECAQALMAEVSGRFGTPLYARIDLVPGPGGEPLLLELEVIEPRLYLHLSEGAAERLAAAVRGS